jgi:hypothetical protein
MAVPVIDQLDETLRDIGDPTGDHAEVAFATAPASTDLIVVWAEVNKNPVTSPSGWTDHDATEYSGKTGHWTYIWYKYGDTANAYDFTWDPDSFQTDFAAMTITGVDATTQIDVNGSTNYDAFGDPTFDSITTTVDDTLLTILCQHENANNRDFDAETGYTQYFGDDTGVTKNQVNAHVKSVPTAGSTGALTYSIVDSQNFYHHNQGIAWKPAAAGGADQEPSLVGGKLVNHGILGRHLVHG